MRRRFDLETRCSNLLDNPFGPRFSPVPVHYVTYVSRPDPGFLARAEGFEPDEKCKQRLAERLMQRLQ